MTEQELQNLLLHKKIKSKCTSAGYYVIICVSYSNKDIVTLELKDENSTCCISSCFCIDDLSKIQERIID